jgi:hypothetical protein
MAEVLCVKNLSLQHKKAEYLPEIAKIFDDSIISGSLVTPKTAGIESICIIEMLVPIPGIIK